MRSCGNYAPETSHGKYLSLAVLPHNQKQMRISHESLIFELPRRPVILNSSTSFIHILPIDILHRENFTHILKHSTRAQGSTGRGYLFLGTKMILTGHGGVEINLRISVRSLFPFSHPSFLFFL